MAANETMGKIHKARVHGPHWYLLGVAVDPELHGQGIGSSIIREGLALTDRESRPCYLECNQKPHPKCNDQKERHTMNRTANHDERIARMTFASAYPHYLTKVERKGRTEEELHEVIRWLTSFDEEALQKQISDNVTFEEFFQRAKLNPNAHLITGVICGYRVEEIENPLTQKARYLDKLVDELAKGRKMEKILRGKRSGGVADALV